MKLIDILLNCCFFSCENVKVLKTSDFIINTCDLYSDAISQSESYFIFTLCRRYNIPLFKIFSLKPHGRKYKVNIYTPDLIRFLISCSKSDKRIRHLTTSYKLKNLLRKMNGKNPYRVYYLSRDSLAINKSRAYFHVMSVCNATKKRFRYLRFIGKDRLDVGYKLYHAKFKEYVDFILEYDLNFSKREDFVQFVLLCDEKHKIGDALTIRNTIDRFDSTDILNFHSFLIARNIYKVLK